MFSGHAAVHGTSWRAFLGKASTVGDTHGLFLRGLDRYIDHAVARFNLGPDPKRVDTKLTAAVIRAQAERDFTDGVAFPVVARLLLCLIEAMRVIGTTGSARDAAQAAITALIDRLVK
jgi:hypothetical protein